MAIDRTRKVAFTKQHPRAKRVMTAEFLRRVLDKLSCQVHTVLIDNAVPFTPQAHLLLPGGHSFDRIYRDYGVAHRLTKPAHPWTNGPAERLTARLRRPPSNATIPKPRTSPTNTGKPFY